MSQEHSISTSESIAVTTERAARFIVRQGYGIGHSTGLSGDSPMQLQFGDSFTIFGGLDPTDTHGPVGTFLRFIGFFKRQRRLLICDLRISKAGLNPWKMQVYGSQHMDEARKLCDALKHHFHVNLHVKLMSESTRREMLWEDLD
ncbi:hypothetical protein A3E39_03640 [Candidatus Uhrbacteria bacterium RIFCSPHIGHO2_12_FULL_60_25]|uniref:Uncharacterized protein n=1 Tax=Candidatus Uhrbacteria bacterium RIFCSPHIGHO2_12_FULL_60_25 TaxID=1802399 RepID=A0A1F7UL64_9BACT|nr:MAG: hypothetical protein A3D73_01625 [Candidatus Uhrbacteria bacterium RIFCSPHIGHO2_02_FULL_60_44]OGL79013.1 MAG: hypothetical protein A3E39_03640 [Candidatus Uhrbacteria bacterium RIFCSPHIGHO2_12_FULL_60_25]